jgi:hypothetical protein
MKFTFLLFAFTAGISTQAQVRGLQSLTQKWNIAGHTFAYDGLHFDLDYQVSDFINDNMVTFAIYDRHCQEGGNSVSNTILKAQKQILTNTYVANGGAGQRMLALDIDIDAATITTDPNIYREDTTRSGAVTAQIDVCVRFSLQTDTTPNQIEVNFRETLVTLHVDLSDGFEIGEVNVASNDNGRIVYSGSQIYETKEEST